MLTVCLQSRRSFSISFFQKTRQRQSLVAESKILQRYQISLFAHFALACLRANLRYGKNQKREAVKSHHYIISFDLKDVPHHGLTVDKAQTLGEKFCTHPDGHNDNGNVHVHIVINSLRIEEVPFLPYMDRPYYTEAGMKHRCTNATMEYFCSEVMEMCHDAGPYQIIC